VVLDFEGEPLLPLARRQDKHSPLKDVAGMLRSIAYAAMHVHREQQHPDTATAETGAAALRSWEQWARAAFLGSYLARAAGAPFLPKRERHLRLLLDAFLLDKAFYEIRYELDNRPDWLPIPLAGLLELLEAPATEGS
jgi:maltose alpha-D-glucosyltransferase/alpha-amylase